MTSNRFKKATVLIDANIRTSGSSQPIQDNPSGATIMAHVLNNPKMNHVGFLTKEGKLLDHKTPLISLAEHESKVAELTEIIAALKAVTPWMGFSPCSCSTLKSDQETQA